MKSKFPKASFVLCLLTAVATLGSGCASIFNSGQRTITVSSQPNGAKVTIVKVGTNETVNSGTTPFSVALEPKKGFFSGQGYVCRIESPGYRTAEVEIRPELSGWYFGNLLLGGVIGMLIVDPATGSMWNLTPDKIDRTLDASQAQILKDGSGFLVVLLKDTTVAEQAKMVRIN